MNIFFFVGKPRNFCTIDWFVKITKIAKIPPIDWVQTV